MSRSLNPFFRKSILWLAFLLGVYATAPNRLWGQANQPSFETTLRKPFRAALSGTSLRGMLDAIRDATGAPYWLDRRVDPDQSLQPVTAGPSVEQAYTNVAQSANLAVLPVDGVMLVGRAAWVDRVGAAWLSQSEETEDVPLPPRISVEWPPLTTPDQAIQRTGLDAAAVDLPHDLWPALRVDAIRSSTLLLLIGAQFDQWPEWDEDRGWQSRPLPERVSIVRRYPASARTNALREASRELDPAVKWKVEKQQSIVETNLRVHRLISRTLREGDAARSRDKPRHRRQPSAKEATFRFELKHAPAGAALTTLANSAGWKLEIGPQAQDACQQRISLDGEEDATLEQWVQRVVEQVDLVARREGNRLLIDKE